MVKVAFEPLVYVRSPHTPTPYRLCSPSSFGLATLKSSSGDVAGVGVSLSADKDRDLPLVVGIESGTPAEEAGLQV